jgi:hypothetical protein
MIGCHIFLFCQFIWSFGGTKFVWSAMMGLDVDLNIRQKGF